MASPTPSSTQLAGTIPTVDIPRAELERRHRASSICSRAPVADSKGDARRLITQGGAYVNNVKVSDVEHKVTLAQLATATMLVVRSGKKDYRLVRAV